MQDQKGFQRNIRAEEEQVLGARTKTSRRGNTYRRKASEKGKVRDYKEKQGKNKTNQASKTKSVVTADISHPALISHPTKKRKLLLTVELRANPNPVI